MNDNLNYLIAFVVCSLLLGAAGLSIAWSFARSVKKIDRALGTHLVEIDRLIGKSSGDVQRGGEAIPKELQQKADGMVRQAFELLDGSFGRIATDLAEFEKSRQDIRQRINSGAKRTDGRIV